MSWEYFDIFQEIFENDRTINIGPTLSSLTLSEQETEVQQECHTNEHTDSLSPVITNSEHQFFSDISYLINLCSSPSSTSSTSSIMYLPFSPVLDNSALEIEEENSVNPSTSNSSHFSNAFASNIGSKLNRHKGLYTLRKEQMLLEEKRVQLLQELIENINTTNKIQQRRNDLLERLLMQRNNREEDGQNS